MIRAAAIILALLVPTTAAGQELERPWLDPDAVDRDEEAESFSRFWERTVQPNKDVYGERLKRAEKFLKHRDAQSRAEADALLRSAIRLAPQQPDAYWYLAHLAAEMGKWKQCAELRGKVALLEPDYQAPSLFGAPQSLDYGLGLCLALSGDHAGALARYKRALAQNDPATNSFAIHWRMGEAYMALGRLQEAISSLVEARRLGSRDIVVHYALAVALDRDEQLARAREVMAHAVRRDSGQTYLTRQGLYISPPEDLYYYIALAKIQPPNSGAIGVSGRSQAAYAITKFRHFLAEHGDGPWRRRAEHHIARLSKEPLSATAMHQYGDAGVDAGKATAAIEKAHAALQACVVQTPGVVYQVRITRVVKSRRGRADDNPFGGAQPVAGVRTRKDIEMETDPKLVTAAQDCLDSAASTIALPPPKGPPGSAVTVAFPVVAQ